MLFTNSPWAFKEDIKSQVFFIYARVLTIRLSSWQFPIIVYISSLYKQLSHNESNADDTKKLRMT